MSETKDIISSYGEFVEGLNKVKNSEASAIISFYKYCWQYGDEHDFNGNKDLIIHELREYGLEPFIYKITEDMNIVFRYQSYCEAVLYVKPYAVDFCILKHWCGSS